MAGGTLNGPNNGSVYGGFNIRVIWNRTNTNLTNNTSTINVQLFVRSNGGANFQTFQSRNGSLNIGGTAWNFVWNPLVVAANPGNNQAVNGTLVASVNRTFTHGNNGQNAVSVRMHGLPAIVVGQLAGINVLPLNFDHTISLPAIRLGTDTAVRIRARNTGNVNWIPFQCGSIIIASSRKYKEFIRPIKGGKSIFMADSGNNEVGLDVIRNLNVVEYNYKNQSDRYLGVIAEDSPDIIDINFSGVDLAKTAFNSVIATQQLSENNEKIKKNNDKISKELKEIKNVIEEINNHIGGENNE